MRFAHVIAGVAVVAALSFAVYANAQVADADTAPESNRADAVAKTAPPTEISEELLESSVMDEITVIAGPDGRTAYEMEMDRIEQMKEAIFADMRLREREEEEVAWRQADRDLENPESRFKWGYSPQAEQRMRLENDYIYDLPMDQTQPATLFRAEF